MEIPTNHLGYMLTILGDYIEMPNDRQALEQWYRAESAYRGDTELMQVLVEALAQGLRGGKWPWEEGYEHEGPS
jgi:hypothetical protein